MSFNGSRVWTLDVLSGKVDFLETAPSFVSNGGPSAYPNYYHFLEFGVIKLTATRIDFPWCGLGLPIWQPRIQVWKWPDWHVRFFLYLDRWKVLSMHALERKKSRKDTLLFSSGLCLFLVSMNNLPGDEIKNVLHGKVSIKGKSFFRNKDHDSTFKVRDN